MAQSAWHKRGARIAAGPQKQNGATAISKGAKYLLTIHAISVAAHGGFVNGEANAGPPNKVQARSVHQSRGRSGSHMPVVKTRSSGGGRSGARAPELKVGAAALRAKMSAPNSLVSFDLASHCRISTRRMAADIADAAQCIVALPSHKEKPRYCAGLQTGNLPRLG
jgi:hypothetical protein